MGKTLQQIKDQVASECGWDLWTSLYTAGKVTDGMIAQVAVRYAEEQKRELVEMLEECASVLTWTLENTTPDSDWETFTNSITNAIVVSKELITKHKQ